MDITKIADFVSNELTSELQEVIFTKDTSGKYYLFNKYIILQRQKSYKVFVLQNNKRCEFTSLKNAAAWCILDNAGKHRDAHRIESLDLKLSSIDVDIAVHKNKIKKTTSNFTALISITKLQQDTYKRRQIISELSYYINTSKIIQDKNFRTKDSKIKHLR